VNTRIKADKKKAELRSREYFRKHWSQLSPFLAKLGESESGIIPSPPPALTPGEEEGSRLTGPVWQGLPLIGQPKALKDVVLRPYQLEGLNWIVQMYAHGVSAILGDEMGLGKTLQSIAFLTWLKTEARLPGPCLVLVPLSILSNWLSEFKRFSPGLRVLRFHTSDALERASLRAKLQVRPADRLRPPPSAFAFSHSLGPLFV